MSYELYGESLYDYTAGVCCGVLVTEKVMRKLAKLQAKHLEDVKMLLTNSDGEVFPSMWTLHYPEGKQTHVMFIDTSESVKSRIKMAGVASPPRYIKTCFIAESMEEAKRMANERFEEVGE